MENCTELYILCMNYIYIYILYTVLNYIVIYMCVSFCLDFSGVMGEYEPKIEAHFPQTVLAAKGVTVRLECFALGK